jgi:hypothetical protein
LSEKYLGELIGLPNILGEIIEKSKPKSTAWELGTFDGYE